MSIEAINWALDLDLQPSQKLVVIVLSNYADSNGICWPSFETLSKKTRLSRRSVVRQIMALEKMGVVSKIKKDFTSSNVYKLHLNERYFVPIASDTMSPVTGSASDTVTPPSDTMSPALVTPCHQTSDTVAPYTSINHQLNPQLTINILADDPKSGSSPDKNNPVGFDLFWKAYPKKVKRKMALKIWKRDKLSRLTELIVSDVEKRKLEHGEWIDGYAPHPSTYLNGELWTDEIKTERPAKKMQNNIEKEETLSLAAKVEYLEKLDAERR